MNPDKIAVHPMEVRGRKFPVAVDVSGWFLAEVDGVEIRAPSREQLHDKLMGKTRLSATRLSIPVVVTSGGMLRRATVTGIHGGTENILLKLDDGKTVQEGAYFRVDVWLRDLTQEEFAEGQRLLNEIDAVRARWRRFTTAHKLAEYSAELRRLLTEGAGIDERKQS